LQEAVFRGNEAGEGGGVVPGNLISTKVSKQVSDVPVFGQVTCALRSDLRVLRCVSNWIREVGCTSSCRAVKPMTNATWPAR